jgi:hypothetical protein
MKGKKVDTEFLSEFITNSIQAGLQTPEQIVESAQAEIAEIDKQIKWIEQKKVIRSKLLDVVATFNKTGKPSKSEEVRILSFFKIQNVPICKMICDQVREGVTTIDELSSMNYPAPDVLFCIKQLLEHKILYKSGPRILRGEMFDEYLRFVLREV